MGRNSTETETTKVKQMRIEGTFDPVPKDIEEAAADFLEAKREKADWLGKMNERREKLISKMQEHGFTSLSIDDGDKTLTLVDAPKIKIEAKKASAGNGDTPADVVAVRKMVAERTAWRKFLCHDIASIPVGCVKPLEESHIETAGQLADAMAADPMWWKSVPGIDEAKAAALADVIGEVQRAAASEEEAKTEG